MAEENEKVDILAGQDQPEDAAKRYVQVKPDRLKEEIAEMKLQQLESGEEIIEQDDDILVEETKADILAGTERNRGSIAYADRLDREVRNLLDKRPSVKSSVPQGEPISVFDAVGEGYEGEPEVEGERIINSFRRRARHTKNVADTVSTFMTGQPSTAQINVEVLPTDKKTFPLDIFNIGDEGIKTLADQSQIESTDFFNRKIGVSREAFAAASSEMVKTLMFGGSWLYNYSVDGEYGEAMGNQAKKLINKIINKSEAGKIYFAPTTDFSLLNYKQGITSHQHMPAYIMTIDKATGDLYDENEIKEMLKKGVDLNNYFTSGYTKRIFNSTELIEHNFESLGINKFFGNITDTIIGDNKVPMHTRDALDHMLKYTIEFGTPLMILPFGMGARMGSKFFKFSEPVIKSLYATTKARQLATGEKLPLKLTETQKSVAQEIEEKIKKQLLKTGQMKPTGKTKGGKNLYEFTVKGEKGFTHTYIAPYNAERVQKAIFNGMYINAALGAGSAAAVTHSILQQMTSNFNDYMYAPYIAGIYGMFKGAYGLSGMLGRRGFGLTHAATGIEAAGLGYLPPRIVWNYTNLTLFGVAGLVLKAFNAGMIGREVGGEFSDLANTVAGKYLLSQASGAPISATKAFRPGLTKQERLNILDEEIALRKMDPATIKALTKMANSDDEELKILRKSMHDIYKLTDEMLKNTGMKGLQTFQHTLDQMTTLSILRSHRAALIKNKRFGLSMPTDSGVLSRIKSEVFGAVGLLNPFHVSKSQFATAFDRYNRAIESQMSTVAVELKSLQKTAGDEPAATALIKAVNKELNAAKADNAAFRKNYASFIKETEDFTGSNYNKAMLQSEARLTQDNDGFFLPEFSSPYFMQPVNLRVDTDTLIKNIKANNENLREANLKYYSIGPQRLYQIAQERYQNIDGSIFVPVNNFINRIDEGFLQENKIINRLLNLPPETTLTVREVRNHAKRKYLNHRVSQDGDFTISDEKLRMKIALLDDALEKGEVILKQGDRPINIDNMRAMLDDQDFLTDRDSMVKFLSEVQGANEESIELLNDLVPAVLKMDDVYRIRTSLHGKLNKSTTFDSKYYELRQSAASIDDGIEALFDESEKAVSRIVESLYGKGATNQQGTVIDKAYLQKQVNLRKAANKWYRENYGRFVKDFRPDNEFSGELSILNLLLKRPDESSEEAIERFNSFFPQTGKTILKQEGTDDAGQAFPDEIINHKETRERMIELSLHTLAKYILKNNASGEVINRIDPEHILRLTEAKILPESQGKRLAARILQIQQDIDNPTFGKVATQNLISDLKTLADDKRDLILNNVVSKNIGIDSLDNTSGIARLVDFLTSDLPHTSIHLNRAEHGKKIETIIDQTKKIQRKHKEITGAERGIKSGQKSIEYAEDLSRNLLDGTHSHPLEIITQIIGQKDIAVLDALDDVLIDSIRKVAITIGDTANPLKGLPDLKQYMALSDDIDPNYALDINPVKFEQQTRKVNKALKALATARIAYGHNVKHAEELLEIVKRSEDMLERSATIVGKEGDLLQLYGRPLPFTMTALTGRVHNAVKGVVSPGFYGIEGIYRGAHEAHANLVRDIIYNADASRVLHKLMMRAEVTRGEMRMLVGMMFKASFRANNEKELDEKIKNTKLTKEMYDYMYEFFSGDIPPHAMKKEIDFKREQEAIRQRDINIATGVQMPDYEFEKGKPPQPKMINKLPIWLQN